MEPIVRKTKKMAKKSALNTAKTAAQAEKKIPAVPVSLPTSWRDEEEQVDYEPETPSAILFPSRRRYFRTRRLGAHSRAWAGRQLFTGI